MLSSLDIAAAITAVPSGRWIVGVSGGADSVALLVALADALSADRLHVAHLNHQSRGTASEGDATFAGDLARSLGLSITVARLSDFTAPPTSGHEAAYRAARLSLFSKLAAEHDAAGVLLAHHADDRAETVLFRLLRGGEATALAGLRREAVIDGLRIHRPLLGVRKSEIVSYLHTKGQPWREDATNASKQFSRNRARAFLRERPEMVDPLLHLADAADALREWTRASTPILAANFEVDALGDLPDPLARAAARRWLIDAGVPANEAGGDAAEAVIEMCRDRAVAAHRDFAGGVRVRRVRSSISATTAIDRSMK